MLHPQDSACKKNVYILPSLSGVSPEHVAQCNIKNVAQQSCTKASRVENKAAANHFASEDLQL